MSQQDLTSTLAESFSALADEVQSLIDRKTILEHKLRFAHEQYQYLADKYAPDEPDISETLAQLQLPPDLHHPTLINANVIPLPRRGQEDNSQHQIALLIREGRRVAHQLSALAEASKDSSSKQTSSRLTMTSFTTMMEQDFTVEGKKGNLQCPFSVKQPRNGSHSHSEGNPNGTDPTPHQSGDPICAAMYEEATSQAPHSASGAAKCPIRYLDRHSPEEIASYVEKNKHKIPRSHQVCIQRYQKSDIQVRKLDAKYGANPVNMIQDLSQLHKPLLPEGEGGDEPSGSGDRTSLDRVESWAQGVSPDLLSESEPAEDRRDKQESEDGSVRDSHFNRPLKEVRVGESPSRPWGISVPPEYAGPQIPTQEDPAPVSPPAVPVQMVSLGAAETPKASTGRPSKCPFDHTKLARGGMGAMPSPLPKVDETPSKAMPTPAGGDPKQSFNMGPQIPQTYTPPNPTFISPEAMKSEHTFRPQMVFNGPVFIGYPMEQAIQFMQHFQNPQ